MLDVHGLVVTPGAAGVLGNPGTIPVNDGAQVAGVPIHPSAKLRMWGINTPTADTINNLKLYSQDMIDPVNGVNYVLGAASVKTQWYDYTLLQYNTGARYITAGTNTGVVAGSGFTIDQYDQLGKCVQVPSYVGNEIVPGTFVFGGALTTNQWGNVAISPVSAMPNGLYALVGTFQSGLTNGAMIRFNHPDFQGAKPGYPVINSEVALATALQVAMNDELIYTAQGEQFIYLSKVLGIPCCPTFRVSNAGTGLTVECLDVQADTPSIVPVFVYLGK